MLTKIDIKHSKKITVDGTNITIIKRPKGFGDSLEYFLHTGTIGKIVHKLTGLDGPCDTCIKRRDRLNQLLPYN